MNPVVSNFRDGVTPGGTSPFEISHFAAPSRSLIAFWQSWKSSTTVLVANGVLLLPVTSSALDVADGVELLVPNAEPGRARGKFFSKFI